MKNVEDVYPLSPMQQGLLFHSIYSHKRGAYVEQVGWTLKGRINEQAFERAWRDVIARHPALRTCFFWEDLKQPLQVVRRRVELPWQRQDWRNQSPETQKESLQVFLESDRRRDFELTKAPLMRVSQTRLSEDTHQFIWTYHHLILDGWSVSLVLRELFQCYKALCGGIQPAIDAPRPFQDYIAWLQQQDKKEAEGYWRERLRDYAGPTPLSVEKKSNAATNEHGRYVTQQVQLSSAATDELRAVARRHQLTLSVLVEGAWALLLSHYSDATDVVFGIVVTGRPLSLSGVEAMVGLFINTLPMRVSMPSGAQFVPWLKELLRQQVQMRQHEHPALSQIHEWSAVPRGQALFHSIVAFDNAPGVESLSEPDQNIEIRDVFRANTHTNYPLMLGVVAGSELSLYVTYDESRFNSTTIARMMTHLESLLLGFEDRRLSDFSFLNESERHQLIAEWNDTGVRYSDEASIPKLFEAQVARSPQAIAAVIDGAHLTYSELNRSSNRLAHRLRALGVGPETRVAIYAERSFEMVRGLMGVLKAGAAYVPLDPTYPKDLLTFMLQDSDVRLLLTQKHLAGTLPEHPARVLFVDDSFVDEWDENPQINVEPESAAYAIYTSGSTGRPKAALNTHRGIINRLLWMQDAYNLTARDCVLQKTPFTFDVSVWELFWPLMAGARLVIAKPGGHQDSDYLVDLIAKQEITTVHFVPSMLRAFLDAEDVESCSQLRLVICSGEVLPFDLQQRFFRRLNSQLHNLYGPTEAAVDVTSWRCRRDAQDSLVPIGRQISNVRIYLLDQELQLVPVGVPGELHIGGVAVGRGYLNRAELTAEGFIPDRFSEEPGARLYKTGDLARYLPDGNIEFLSRLDYQVKLRGFRIELGEVEARLGQHPAVREAVVVALPGDHHEKRLAAYITLAPDCSIKPGELYRFLRYRVPQHMLPSGFTVLERMPLTGTGKVDRRALPAFGSRRPELEEAFVAPRTKAEEALTAIWKDVLGIDQVGIHDNFFELGGDSIVSMQVVSRAKQADLNLVPRDLFEHQTIAQLAAAAGPLSGSSAEQGIVSGLLPLTPIQHWFFEQNPVSYHHFNQAFLLEARQNVNPELLKNALDRLVVHHDALRLRLVESVSGWRQENASHEDATLLLVVDLSELRESEYEEALGEAAAELQANLNLTCGPILRAALFDFGRSRPGKLLLVIHHLAVDGVSWRILLEDLGTVYHQLRDGTAAELPPKTCSFAKWAERLADYARSEAIEREADYWLAEAKKAAPALPRDFERGENTVASASNVRVTLTGEETRSLLQDVPKAYHLQVNDVLLTALVRTFTRWTGEEHLLINLEGHGRESPFEDVDVTRTVGWFTSLFPVRLELGQLSPGAALRSVKEQLRAVPNRGFNYGLLFYLNERLGPSLRGAAEPEACFNYLGQLDQVLDQSSLFGEAGEAPGPAQSPSSRRKHLLDITGGILGGELFFVWTYSENSHARSTIEDLARDFVQTLRSLVVHCQSPDPTAFTSSDFSLSPLKQRHIDQLTGGGRRIEDIYALSPMQEGMLFHAVRSPESEIYCEQMSINIRGKLDISAFERAWQELVARHSILRAAFVWKNLDDPVQVIHRHLALRVENQDWRALARDVRSEELEGFRQADRKRGFDLSDPPLMRLTLLRIDEELFELIWTYHHIVLDGWSVPLLFKEVLEAYEGLSQGRPSSRKTAHSYREYIDWLKQQDLRKAEAFWRERLRGFTALTPFARSAGPVAIHGEQDGYDQQQIALSRSVTDDLRVLAREQHLTLNTLAQGCWALLLSHYSGESDIVFGATVSGRPAELAGAETMIGLFINTLPVRVQFKDDERVLTLLTKLQAQQAEASRYVYSPLAQVQAWSELPRGEPLFESLMVFENYPVDLPLAELPGGLEISSSRNIERTDYPLTVIIVPNDELTVRLVYDCRRFGRTMMTRMLAHLQSLLEDIATGDDQILSRLSLLSEAEKHATVIEWNDTGAEYPTAVCFHHMVEIQVMNAPDALAVSFEGQHISYGELNARANQLAHYLRRLGVGLETRVGIGVGRSPEMVIGRLAVLKAGGAYVSLDPEYPAARLVFMLEDAGAHVLLAERRLVERLGDLRVTVVCPFSDWELISRESQDIPDVPMSPDNLAYVYYSSGSTGKPKGVEIEHAGLVNLVTWHNHAYRVTAADRKSQLSGLAFDASVWELWPYLVAGASLHIPAEETRNSWPELLDWMAGEAITICFLPTPLAEAVMDEWPAGVALRSLLTGGDRLHHWPQKPLSFSFVNKYGPTEVTAVTTWAPMTPAIVRNPSPPIGRPIANIQTFALNDHLQPVPMGMAGELCIGGIGLARGYLNRADLTAEKFMPNPFNAEPGARLYRSGDLVCYLPDGNIAFLGRRDYQVKIRGYRIELGEIEKSLAEHSDVRAAVVSVIEDPPGRKQLVGYIMPDDGVVPAISQLREFLLERLPEYMVPSVFITLNSLPLTPNGKIDRRALPRPELAGSESTRTYAAPRTHVERVLAEIWAQVLGVDRVGTHDNFFELGGDSIQTIRIIARAGQRGIEISPDLLFRNPTIYELANLPGLEATASMNVEGALENVRPLPEQRETPGKAGVTVADFPSADLNQRDLDHLLARFAKQRGGDGSQAGTSEELFPSSKKDK
jgi:amino acid adenylation domain-containing protein/non-ribosomal peptide synthase protein (TIGR01720 family)